MSEKLEQIIFNVSGTILDDIEHRLNATYDVLKRAGYEKTPCGKYKLTQDWLKKHTQGHSVLEILKKFGVNGNNSTLQELYKKSLEMYALEHPVSLYPGIYTMLFELIKNGEDLDLTIISSYPKKRLDSDLKRLNISDFFSKVVGNSQNESQDIISLTQYFNSNNNKTVYIADTASDMIAANKAGIIPLGVSWGYESLEQIKNGNPHLIFNNVSDLSNYLIQKI